MKKMFCILAFVLAFALPISVFAGTEGLPPARADNMTRVGIPQSGKTIKIAAEATSNATAQLVSNSIYSFVCDTSVFVEWGDSSAPTATDTSCYIPSDTIIYFATLSSKARFVAVLRVRGIGSCWLLEWK